MACGLRVPRVADHRIRDDGEAEQSARSQPRPHPKLISVRDDRRPNSGITTGAAGRTSPSILLTMSRCMRGAIFLERWLIIAECSLMGLLLFVEKLESLSRAVGL